MQHDFFLYSFCFPTNLQRSLTSHFDHKKITFRIYFQIFEFKRAEMRQHTQKIVVVV